jgi:hypothetical protein
VSWPSIDCGTNVVSGHRGRARRPGLGSLELGHSTADRACKLVTVRHRIYAAHDACPQRGLEGFTLTRRTRQFDLIEIFVAVTFDDHSEPLHRKR